MSFLIIKPGSVLISHEQINLELMQSLVEGRIEIVREQFTDKSIDLVCNDEFILNGSTLTCATREHIFLHGTILAVAVNSEGDTIGLSDKQINIVREELEVIDEIGFLLLARNFLQFEPTT